MSDVATAETKPDAAKAAEVQHDLDYYLAHQDEMPTDPAVLERLIQASAEKDAAAGGVDGGHEPGKAAPAKADEPPKPDGVLTKDGKHVLPYSELERRVEEERSRTGEQEAARRAAEEHARELQRQLEEAQARAAAVERGEHPGDKTKATEISEEMLARIRDEYPTFAALYDAQKGLIDGLNAKVEELGGRIGNTEKDIRATEAEEVDGLIAQVPDLAAWQKGTPAQQALFARAQVVEQDLLAGKLAIPEGVAHNLDALKKDDVARYGVVADIVKREVGLPVASPEKKPDPKAQTETLRKEAEKKVDGAEPPTPRSLSDLNGGTPPAGSEVDALDGMAGYELGNRFMKMTDEQRSAYLARL